MNIIKKKCKTRITLFGRINWTTYGLKTITVQDAIDIIKDGTLFIDDTARSGTKGTLRDITLRIQQQLNGTNIQLLKNQFLPAVTFNGVYNNGIVEYSGVTALDFDHIPSQEKFTDLYKRLMATPCVGWIYRTPSGRGLKALILHDNTDYRMHDNMYKQLMHKFKTPYIKTDSKCKDLSRRNYLCYDPDVWTNPSPIPYHFIYNPAYDTLTRKTHHSNGARQVHEILTKQVIADGLPSDASIMNLLKSRCKRFHPEYLTEGARRDGVYWFGTQASKAGVNYQYGLDYVQKLYRSNEITLVRGDKFTEDEVIENYTNGYKTEIYDEEYRKSFNLKKLQVK